MNCSSIPVRNFIKNLAAKIKFSPSILKSDEISSIMIGLHGMDPLISDEVVDLVKVLQTKFRQFRGELSPQCIASCIYGLRWFQVSPDIIVKSNPSVDRYGHHIEHHNSMKTNDRCKVIHEFVDTISFMIAKHGTKKEDSVITSQGVAMIMKGLQLMGSDSLMSRQLIKNVVPFLQVKRNDDYDEDEDYECRACLGFKPVEIGIALSGLRNMETTHPEVRELLKVLIARTSQGKGLLSSLDLGIALSGMRKLSNTDPLEAELYDTLLKRVDRNSITKEPHALSVALGAHGMQNFIIPNPMLHIFVQQLEQCYKEDQILNGQGLGMLLYGLSNTLNHNIKKDGNTNIAGDDVEIALLNIIEKHTQRGNFIVDHRAASLAYHAFNRINNQEVSYELMEKIENTLVEMMRKLDRALLLKSTLETSEEQLERMLDRRESNRFFNSMRYLGKIINAFNSLPPAISWLPILVGFFMLNEQLQKYNCDMITYMA